MIHFTSDQHFGHKNIIAYDSRPFDDLDHMHEVLIDNYNKSVKPSDSCIWVGDAFFCKDMRSILDRMNGSKILVRGNHDNFSKTRYLDAGFDDVVESTCLKVGGVVCRVSHFPKPQDFTLSPGEVLIHGHTHSTRKCSKQGIHVGVTAWDYRPASIIEVQELI